MVDQPPNLNEQFSEAVEPVTPEELALLEPKYNISHPGSGVNASVSGDGNIITIGSLGNGRDGDPLVGVSIHYNRAEGTITTFNYQVINQNLLEGYDGRSTIFRPEFTEGGAQSNLGLTGSQYDAIKAAPPGGPLDETGFSEVSSEDTMFLMEIYDTGRVSQGAVVVQHVDDKSGEMTLITLSANAVQVSKVGMDDMQVSTTGPVDISSAFDDRDFRAQPAPAARGPGMGN